MNLPETRGNARLMRRGSWLGIIIAGITIVAFAAVALIWHEGLVGTASSKGRGDLPQQPSPQFASSVVHYTMTEYINYEVRPDNIPLDARLAQTKLITDRWVELDSLGNLKRVKNVTRLPSGELWQERLYQDGTEIVNWYRYPGSQSACRQSGPFEEAGGSSLPFSSDAQLQGAGFRETNRPLDLAKAPPAADAHSFERAELRSPAPGFQAGRAVAVRDNASGQRLADLFFGLAADGSETLLQSTTFSPVARLQQSPGGIFTITQLPAGCGQPR